MISKWSKQDYNSELEYIKKGEKEFIDERGKISNFELPEPINLVGYMTQKKKVRQIIFIQYKNKKFY